MRVNSQAKGPELDEKLWKDISFKTDITEEAISPIWEGESFRYQDGDAYKGRFRLFNV